MIFDLQQIADFSDDGHGYCCLIKRSVHFRKRPI